MEMFTYVSCKLKYANLKTNVCTITSCKLLMNKL